MMTSSFRDTVSLPMPCTQRGRSWHHGRTGIGAVSSRGQANGRRAIARDAHRLDTG